MDFTTILTNDEGGGIFTIKLNRPERRNAISIRMRNELSACLKEMAASETVRVVILTGMGHSFSAGFDLNELTQPENPRKLASTTMTYHRHP